jgi:hypothetical protein
MCISAYLVAGRALSLPGAVEFALRSLERVLSSAWQPETGLAHVVAYGEGVPSRSRVPGVLDDYGFLATAALDAWEATGEMSYFHAAQELADAMLARFYDKVGDAFFDTELVEGAAQPIGALSARRKPLQDSPTPAGNSIAAALLLRLHALTGREEYRTRAEDTLETFAGVVEHFGLYAASYGLALRLLVESPVQVCIVGEGALAADLELAAMARYALNKSVVRLRPEQMRALPAALAETLPHLPLTDGAVAIVCRGQSCLPPTSDPDELLRMLNGAV